MELNSLFRSENKPVCIRSVAHKQKLVTTLEIQGRLDLEFEAPERADTIRRLSEEIRRIVKSNSFGSANFAVLQRQERRALLAPVAEAGFELFKALIKRQERDDFLSALDAQDGPEGAVSVRNSGVKIPWELVYVEPVVGDVNIVKFMGQDLLFARIASSGFASDRDGSTIRTRFPSQNEPGRSSIELGVVYDDKKFDPPRPVGNGWFMSRPRLKVDTLHPLLPNPPLRTQMKDALAAFLLGAKDSFLFCCRSETSDVGRPQAIDMRVRDDYLTTFDDAKAWRMRFHDEILVVFDVDNAAYCGKSPESLAERMHRNGASAVVAPMGPVNSDTSETLSELLFLGLETGASVATALLRARRKVMEDELNPTALLWTAFGDVWKNPVVAAGAP